MQGIILKNITVTSHLETFFSVCKLRGMPYYFGWNQHFLYKISVFRYTNILTVLIKLWAVFCYFWAFLVAASLSLLTHFMRIVSFYTPRKTEQWHEIGSIIKKCWCWQKIATARALKESHGIRVIMTESCTMWLKLILCHKYLTEIVHVASLQD